MISFGARFIKSAEVQKINTIGAENTPKKVPCACVELDPNDRADVDSILLLEDIWQSEEEYERVIGENLQSASSNDYLARKRYFAVTLQEDDFEYLDPEKIVAISQVHPFDDSVNVECLQAKPKPVSMFSDPYKIKYAGTQMLNTFKEIFKGKKITLDSAKSARKFYLKNGFVENKRVSDRFVFYA